MIMNKLSKYIAWFLFTFLVTSGLGLAAQPQSHPLSEAEYRGKRIFLEGKTESGKPIVALLSGVEVPASVLPCGSCHGSGGRGNTEGGVQPSDIRWEVLSRSYQNTNNSGRLHPPYNEISLKKAITLGLDPAGNTLNQTMPRYKISMPDMLDLMAYIKRLGTDLDEGLTSESIKIACLLPPGGMENDLVKTAAAAIHARFDQLNQAGGIYGRKIDPVLFSETTTSGSVIEFLEKERPFALSSSFLSNTDSAFLAYLNRKKIPLCGAIAENISQEGRLSAYIFYLYADRATQISGLLQKATSQTPGDQSILIVCPEAHGDIALEKMIGEAKKLTNHTVEILKVKTNISPKGIAGEIAARKPGAVLYLNGGELNDLLYALQDIGIYPFIFVPGSSAGKQIFSAPSMFHKKVILSYPTWVDQITDQGFQAFRELQQQYKLPQSFQNTQMTCLAATNLIIDGLKACGNELSREKLLKVTASGGTFKSGLIPDLTFTTNKRIGSTVVFLTELDLEKKTMISLNY